MVKIRNYRKYTHMHASQTVNNTRDVQHKRTVISFHVLQPSSIYSSFLIVGETPFDAVTNRYIYNKRSKILSCGWCDPRSYPRSFGFRLMDQETACHFSTPSSNNKYMYICIYRYFAFAYPTCQPGSCVSFSAGVFVCRWLSSYFFVLSKQVVPNSLPYSGSP